MSVNLSPLGGAGAQFFTNDGVPLSGGLLYTYLAGTTTPATTYTSSNGITALANPIILDAAGRVPTGEIWLTDGINYKFVLKDSTDVLIATWDGLSGINSNFIAYTSLEETATATAGQTVFNLSIDYIAGANSLAVFVNGSNQIVNVNYLETDSNTVTFLTGLNVGDVVKFSTATPVATNAMDAANVSYTPAGVGAVITNVQTKLRAFVSVKDFGAVGDFNPATGVGTDDRAAIQAALTYIGSTGGTLTFPPGKYYLGTEAVSNIAAVELGVYGGTSGQVVSNIEIEAYGATLYLGNVGKVFGLFNCNNVAVKGLSILGYHGGSLGVSRQYDHNIVCMSSAVNVSFEDVYSAGALGDQLYLGGYNSAIAGGECINIKLTRCTLKSRYGNGVPSYSSGTGSRTALAVINCSGLSINGSNQILGIVDLEPNVSGQYLKDVNIGTRFSNGQVTAESVIGSNLWLDEPIVLTGGTDIECAIITGSPASSGLICSGNNLDGNTFETGHINLAAYAVLMDSISNNRFQSGLIRIAVNTQDNLVIENNKTKINNLAAETYYGITTPTFISLSAATINNTRISGNTCVIPSGYCVSTNGTGTDGGSNFFSENKNLSATALGDYSFNPSINSYVDYMQGTFTPTALGTTTAGVGTYTGQTGSFTRNGNRLTFNAYMSWSAHTGTGSLYFEGLPYAAASGSRGRCAISVWADSLIFTGQLVGTTNTSETAMYISQMASGASSTLPNMDTSAQVRISGSYPIV
jgi:hypothetical protein